MSVAPSASSSGAAALLVEWRVPVSSRLSVQQLTLIASACRSLGCHAVAFAFRAAAGKPLPEAPTREQLRQIAAAASLHRVLARLDLEDITDTVALPKLLAAAKDRFDMYAVIISKDDPLLCERVDISAAMAPVVSAALPLVVNIDAVCTSPQIGAAIILPRKRLPARTVIEVSYSLLQGTAANDVIRNLLASTSAVAAAGKPPATALVNVPPALSVVGMASLRAQLPRFGHLALLVSCGGDVIGPQEVEAAALCRLRSPVDAACLAEAMAGRAQVLETGRNMSRRMTAHAEIAAATKQARQLVQAPAASSSSAAAAGSKAARKQQQQQQRPTACVVPAADPSFLDAAALATMLRKHFARPSSSSTRRPASAAKRRGGEDCGDEGVPHLIQRVPHVQSTAKRTRRRRQRSADRVVEQPSQRDDHGVADHLGWSEE